jgi:DNA-binding NtrC family response regulator
MEKLVLDGKDITVLIIDSNDAPRTAMAQVALGAGYNVRTAASTNEALSQLDGSDIMVLDWGLGDGDPVLAEWVGRCRGPSLILRDYLDVRECHQLIVRGAFHCVRKPVGAEVILTILRRYVRCVRADRMLESLVNDVEKLKSTNRKLKYGVVVALALAMMSAGEPVFGVFKSLFSLF